MKIALVGEAPADTSAIKNLLSRQSVFQPLEFCTLLENLHGSQLDNQKTKRQLRREYEIERPDLVIFIRDLDGTLQQNATLQARQDYFTASNSVVDRCGLFLLNIFEIEALLVADIESFNRYFNCNAVYHTDPMLLHHPKEFLRSCCKKYQETYNPELFKYLSFETVIKNCSYFNKFINTLCKSAGLIYR